MMHFAEMGGGAGVVPLRKRANFCLHSDAAGLHIMFYVRLVGEYWVLFLMSDVKRFITNTIVHHRHGLSTCTVLLDECLLSGVFICRPLMCRLNS
ncbi:hypothetical protein F7725_012815 [Dissostichus mawsoni]|uniref:Uncharacterized protein n=1 Tax=Dissostichus mawsoni TaxID=36200 RepID=A0A7J5YPH7_DISMA|nr:hypothetical protein F7725_012815 [Dissostichus mawsoni]